MDYQARIERVRSALESHGVDGLLVTHLDNVRYLTGFSGTNGQVLVTATTAFFFSDPRYEARAGEFVQGAEVVIYEDRVGDVLPERLPSAARLGVEAATLTLAEHERLQKALGDVSVVPVHDVVEELRRAKDTEEVALIREAVRIADDAFSYVLERLAPGITERDLALDLEVHMRRAGADDVSFAPIVGSGPLSAHIHHTAGARELQKGDLVLLDFGARYEGYCSDLSRTVVLGPANDEQQDMYELVLEAQRRALATVSSGVGAVQADGAARRVIESAGFGELFGHGTGHGVGIEIHEAPRLSKFSHDVLAEHDVVTVEPGVYRPGFGGVRIEDCVLVTRDRAVVLGKAPKDELIQV